MVVTRTLPDLKPELVKELKRQFKIFCLTSGLLDEDELLQDQNGYWTNHATSLLYSGYEIKSVQEAVEWKQFNSSTDVFDADIFVIKHQSGKTGINPAALGS